MTDRPASGPVVGIVGGGQLARMLAEAATPLGVHVRVLAAPGDEGAAEVIPDVQIGSPDDPASLRSFAASVDVVTFDHENVDHGALAEIEAAGTPVRPSVETLRFSDKAHQRREFAAAGLPVPPFEVVDPGAEAAAALDAAQRFATAHADADGRIVAKASRGGYDGRGVWMLTAGELPDFLAAYEGAPLVLEPRLPLDLEVAVLAARRPSGEVVTWPILETVQVDGMCDEVLWPASLAPELADRAREIGQRVAEVTGAVGVLAVELFVSDGELVVNEIAPRVHNSGHLTIEGSRTSQFEQHLRAVLDWPLGPTEPTAPSVVMANVVGGPEADPRDRQAEALAVEPGANIHLYGKTSRPGRKIGHVTVLGGDDLAATRRAANTVADTLAGT
ncbi:MAG: 5-(carboxyamino)imidazole ribonucleotide synthase [Actinomycetota bacterium]|nr:5-(carboxyamino)imidazole ribonucleotide synthase [Actinomycetota bacterium]